MYQGTEQEQVWGSVENANGELKEIIEQLRAGE
jgi:hypothetical protein